MGTATGSSRLMHIFDRERPGVLFTLKRFFLDMGYSPSQATAYASRSNGRFAVVLSDSASGKSVDFNAQTEEEILEYFRTLFEQAIRDGVAHFYNDIVVLPELKGRLEAVGAEVRRAAEQRRGEQHQAH